MLYSEAVAHLKSIFFKLQLAVNDINLTGSTLFVFWMVMAPAVVNPLPKIDELGNKLIAPLAITVPLKTVLSPKINAPLTYQYTFLKFAELINKICVAMDVDKAPFTLITNTALGLPKAFKVNVPFMDASVVIQ